MSTITFLLYTLYWRNNKPLALKLGSEYLRCDRKCCITQWANARIELCSVYHCVIWHFRSQRKYSEPSFSNHPPTLLYVSGCGHGKQNGGLLMVQTCVLSNSKRT